MKSTIRTGFSSRVPDAESLLAWCQREAQPVITQLRDAACQTYRAKVRAATTGTAAWTAAWTGDPLRAGEVVDLTARVLGRTGGGSVGLIEVAGTFNGPLLAAFSATVVVGALNARVALTGSAPSIEVVDAGVVTEWVVFLELHGF